MDLLTRTAITRAQAALAIAAPASKAGRDFLRAVIARAVDPSDPWAYACKRWGSDSAAALVCRAAVGAADRDDLLTADSGRDEFFASVLEQSVLGKMTAARRVPFNTRCIAPTTGAAGYWIGESKAAKVSKITLDGLGLDAKRVAALVIATNESLADPEAEGRVFADIETAVVNALDEAFCGDQAGTAATPAGITNGLTPVASTGSAVADFSDLLAAFTGDLDQSAVVTDPVTAAQLNLTGAQAFARAGVRGGEALGLPLIVSRSSARDSNGGQIILADQSAIAVALGGIELVKSRDAMIEADDAPTGDAEAPTAATATRINTFTNELTAFKSVLHANWRPVRAGAVAVIGGADYLVGS